MKDHFQTISSFSDRNTPLSFRFPRNLELLCPRSQKLQIYPKLSVPKPNVERGLSKIENRNASSLSSRDKSPIDPKTSLSSNISGGKSQTIHSSLFPLTKTIRSNDEHERNIIKQSKDKTKHVVSTKG